MQASSYTQVPSYTQVSSDTHTHTQESSYTQVLSDTHTHKHTHTHSQVSSDTHRYHLKRRDHHSYPHAHPPHTHIGKKLSNLSFARNGSPCLCVAWKPVHLAQIALCTCWSKFQTRFGPKCWPSWRHNSQSTASWQASRYHWSAPPPTGAQPSGSGPGRPRSRGTHISAETAQQLHRVPLCANIWSLQSFMFECFKCSTSHLLNA